MHIILSHTGGVSSAAILQKPVYRASEDDMTDAPALMCRWNKFVGKFGSIQVVPFLDNCSDADQPNVVCGKVRITTSPPYLFESGSRIGGSSE